MRRVELQSELMFVCASQIMYRASCSYHDIEILLRCGVQYKVSGGVTCGAWNACRISMKPSAFDAAMDTRFFFLFLSAFSFSFLILFYFFSFLRGGGFLPM
jgi:hypothetical protein